MENVAPVLGNPLHQLTEARRQMPSFYAANIAAMATAPATKALPPSMRVKKRRGGSVISSSMSEVEETGRAGDMSSTQNDENVNLLGFEPGITKVICSASYSKTNQPTNFI
eukprot:sb/3477161/